MVLGISDSDGVESLCVHDRNLKHGLPPLDDEYSDDYWEYNYWNDEEILEMAENMDRSLDKSAGKKNYNYDGRGPGGNSGHRDGKKRPKTDFWNRLLTRWHKHHKNRRQQQEAKKMKKRYQKDNQLQM